MDLLDAQNSNKLTSIFYREISQQHEVEASNTEEQKDIKTENLLSKLFVDSLPIQATSNDVREVVRFLKNKPSGLSFAEILSSEPRRIFEPRKIDAYEFWGIIRREGERVKLTDLGYQLAKIVTSENGIFEGIISSIPIYVEIIKWIHQQQIKLVTHPDVNEFFTQLKQKGQFINVSEAEVVSFFSICHAAELGVATVGKRGQPARLKIESIRIKEFLSPNKNRTDLGKFKSNQSVPSKYTVGGRVNYRKSAIIERVYISGAFDTEIAQNLYSALELADFESVVFDEDEKDDHLQSGKLQKMHLCQAGVIIISDRDCLFNTSQKTEMKSNRLTELTAAAGLFNWRLVIIWNNKFPIPDYLQHYDLEVLAVTSDNFQISYQTVKRLKDMKYSLIDQTES